MLAANWNWAANPLTVAALFFWSGSLRNPRVLSRVSPCCRLHIDSTVRVVQMRAATLVPWWQPSFFGAMRSSRRRPLNAPAAVTDITDDTRVITVTVRQIRRQ